MEYFLRDATTLFDPFAGWGERHIAAKNANKVYLGYDISQNAIEFAKSHYKVNNILANSLTEEIPYHDGLITCPPYWNLEKRALTVIFNCIESTPLTFINGFTVLD